MIYIKDIDKYYENTKNAQPHDNVQKFIRLKTKVGNAIDLGCGTGRDTVSLIKNGWSVTAIDRENTIDIIESKLNNEELENLKFICQSFENIKKLEKSDLIVANFSIPFCDKNSFNKLWSSIVDSINYGRIFCW